MQTQTTDLEAPQVPLGAIALIGVATLLLELLLTRIFSVTMWYHFAFVAISLALFGVAASGVATTVIPALGRRDRAVTHMGYAAVAFGVSIPLALAIDLTIPFEPFDVGVGARPYLLFLAKFIVLATPFFFSGLVLALAFTHATDRVNRVYFFDLGGGALGCMAVVPLLNGMSGPSGVILAGAVPLLAGAMFLRAARRKRSASAAVLAAVAVLGMAALNDTQGFIAIDRVKSYDPNQAQEVERAKIYEEWHSVSRVAVHPPDESGTPIVWFYGEGKPDFFPTVMEVTNDAGARTYLYPKMPKDARINLFDDDLSDMVYGLVQEPSVLVIGVGGGKDVLSALTFDASKVTAVELNPLMIYLVQELFPDFTGSPFDDPRAHVVIDEGRSYVASHDELFDVIKLSGTDTWAASAGGGYALSESYLYTVEAFHDFLDHLSADGYLTITRWYPQETLRLAALAAHVLRERGHDDVENRVLMARNASNVTLMIKSGVLTEDESRRFVERVEGSGLVVVHAPYLDTRTTPGIDDLHRDIVTAKSVEEVAARAPVLLDPPTDDRPFFFSLVTFGAASSGDLGATGGFLLQHGRSLALLAGLMKISAVVVLLFIVLPLFLLKKAIPASIDTRTRLLVNLYFVMLGLGYLLVEIPLLQRFILYLGHPVYSLTVVLFSMLLSSGVGSIVGASFATRRGISPTKVLLVCAVVVLATAWLQLPVLHATISLPTPARIALSILLIAPVGFVMGMPFPLGIRVTQERAPALVPWAWGVNGAASVLAPVLAMLVAITAGFATVLLIGAGAYLMGMLIIFMLLPRDP